MKKPLLAAILVTTSLAALAQIPKGTSTVGGSVSLSRQEKKNGSSKNTTTTFDLSPGYGLFIINNLCIGANAAVSLSRSASNQRFQGQLLNNDRRSVGAGPFVRYYLPVNAKLYAFGHAGYMWQWNKYEYEILFDGGLTFIEAKDRSHSWNVGAGLSYFLTPNVALEAMAGYTGYRYKNPNNGFTYVLPEDKGLFALNIGFRIFLRKSS